MLPVGSIPPIAPLWAIGIKDFEKLGTRFDAHHAEWVNKRIARDEPTTLGGVLKFLGRQTWTAYGHPIRAWRGEFDRPKKRTTDGGGTEPRICSYPAGRFLPNSTKAVRELVHIECIGYRDRWLYAHWSGNAQVR